MDIKKIARGIQFMVINDVFISEKLQEDRRFLQANLATLCFSCLTFDNVNLENYVDNAVSI
jgi:hypothetical protein